MATRRCSVHEVDVLLVCSPGGHLLQLTRLASAWEGRRRAWVTLPGSDERSLLAGETVIHAHGPTARNAANAVRNLALAWRVIRSCRPKALVTTGAGLAVPFVWVAWLFRVPVVYVESLTRIRKPSLSCRLVRPTVDRLYVQWPELRSALPDAEYVGSLFTVR